MRKLLLFVQYSLLCAALTAIAGCSHVVTVEQPKFVFSPYKDINKVPDLTTALARIRLHGQPVPLGEALSRLSEGRVDVVTLAFASGECGEERWGVLDAQKVATANVRAFRQQGLRYIISTGGEGGVFTCATDAGMEAFIARYESGGLLGMDFDIEANQTPAQMDAIALRVKAAQVRRPHLRFSFTLATFASADGSQAGLNATGKRVLAALRAADVSDVYLNLMVMNFGPALAQNCVVVLGRCDMAASARQAVLNLHAVYGVSLSLIEVTAMIGVNDVVDNVFTLDDARSLARYVRDARLGGLHFWSLDRDGPCAHGPTAVSPMCSSLNTHPTGAFLQTFVDGLRQK